MTHTRWEGISLEIVDQAVAQTFQLLIESDAEPRDRHPVYGSDDICMGVYCDEEQQSAVVVRCSRPMAVILTSRMLESEPATLQDEEIIDATGELVNVIAGSLRGLMDSPGAMSTPFALTGEEVATLPCLDQREYNVGDLSMHLIRV